MPMNQVIQQRRRALGLTQEQLANRLGVTAPAVNKWEKGATCPDVTLLPALARLLEIDLNALFCFQERMTSQEIALFSQDVLKIAQRDGLEAGFAMATDKLRAFPNCAELRYQLATLMEGVMILSGSDEAGRAPYEQQIFDWYEACLSCTEGSIRDCAAYMLAGRYLRRDDAENAQRMLNLIPDLESPDKRLLQAELHLRRGETEEAGRLLSRALMMTINTAQNFLWKQIDVELVAGNIDDAASIAEISRAAVELFELWDYNAAVAPLHVALARRDAHESVRLLRQLLEASGRAWVPSETALYRRLADTAKQAGMHKMLRPLLSDLETNPDYDFLRADANFEALIAEYRRQLEAP